MLNDRALRADAAIVDGTEDALDIGAFDLLPPQIDVGREGLGAQAAGRDIDDPRLDCEARRALGHADNGAHRLFGLLDIGDHAGLDAGAGAVAEADDLDHMRAAAQRLALGTRRQPRDDAADLGRANIEHGYETRTPRLHRLQACGHGVDHHGFFFFFSASALSLTAGFRASMPSTLRSMSVTSRSSSVKSRW